MSAPTNEEIMKLLDQLDRAVADDLETLWLEFKPWTGPKNGMKEAVEAAICLANSEGGVIVFGVADRTKGRAKAIHGAKGYDLDVWRRGIYDSTRPNLAVEVSEVPVPEGTGKLLIVRVPKGLNPPYGTAQGLFKIRVGKNCMPLDPARFQAHQMSTGAIDWSAHLVENISFNDLDPVEIARARNILRNIQPESDLLQLEDKKFLTALGALRNNRPTRTGLLLFGKENIIRDICPQHQVHYVYQKSDTEVSRSDSYNYGLLQILERLEQIFTGPINPEHELSVGLFKIRIPDFPIEVVREAILNAVTHRDYTNPNEVLIRHTKDSLILTSPGGFIAGITPENILHHEPASRNRTLAMAFEKLRLVERAGIGRRRIFIPLLRFGKRTPKYESETDYVTLRIFNGSYDDRMAKLAAKWAKEGREIDLDSLLVLTFLREHAYLNITSASNILQRPIEETRSVLDSLSHPKTGILERRGRTKGATYHLAKGIAKDLLGKAAYTKTRGLDPIRYAEMIKEYLKQHNTISPQECRELLGLGNSKSAMVEMSRYLTKWSSGSSAFLKKHGTRGAKVRYSLLES